MAGLNDTAKNLMLNELASVGVYVSLHTADPGPTGTSEVTGGSPAYARIAATWPSASGGSLSLTNDPVFNVPGSTTVAFFGVWSAVSGGTFYGSGGLSSSETFAGQGTYTLTAATVSVS